MTTYIHDQGYAHTHTRKKNNLESRNKTRIQVVNCQHQHEGTLEVLYRISPQNHLKNSKCTVFIESAMKQTSCLYTDVHQTASEQTDLRVEEIMHSRTMKHRVHRHCHSQKRTEEYRHKHSRKQTRHDQSKKHSDRCHSHIEHSENKTKQKVQTKDINMGKK
jgi:hypothetical protein